MKKITEGIVMKKILVLASVLVVTTTLVGPDAFAGYGEVQGDAVRSWNNLALQTVRTENASDAQAARLYAMVNVAMYDAVNGTADKGERRDPALVPPDQGADGDPRAAVGGAAHDVLVGLYPDQAALYDVELASDLAAIESRGRATHGREWGGRVAMQVLQARANDGSSPVEPPQPGGSEPGVFRTAWSGVQFRNLQPFAIADPGVYVSPGQPALDSLDYAAAFAEVKLLGNAAIPDPAKSATYQYWSLGNGTDQAPGAWLQVAQTVSADRSLSLADTARLFALESMAMADTVAPSYTTKFIFHSWRPTTAIREAGTDGNPNTTADTTWSARAGSVGSSPEHWSGHSSFSAAAATILGGFFCSDHIPFSLVTDSSTNAQPRMYSSFSEAASEAGRSRVFGGLHFEFSNQAGLTAGRAIAAEVLSHSLLLKKDPTHTGDCPL